MPESSSDLPPDARGSPRYTLALPVEFDGGTGVTRDVSATSVYLFTDVACVIGDTLEFTLVLPGEGDVPVRVRCRGVVVAIDDAEGRCGLDIAIDSFTFGGTRVDLTPPPWGRRIA